MTLRKYKKVLMSLGFDRDQAEQERKDYARWKRNCVLLGLDPNDPYYSLLDNNWLVEFRKEEGRNTRRGNVKYMKRILRNVVTV